MAKQDMGRRAFLQAGIAALLGSKFSGCSVDLLDVPLCALDGISVPEFSRWYEQSGLGEESDTAVISDSYNATFSITPEIRTAIHTLAQETATERGLGQLITEDVAFTSALAFYLSNLPDDYVTRAAAILERANQRTFLIERGNFSCENGPSIEQFPEFDDVRLLELESAVKKEFPIYVIQRPLITLEANYAITDSEETFPFRVNDETVALLRQGLFNAQFRETANGTIIAEPRRLLPPVATTGQGALETYISMGTAFVEHCLLPGTYTYLGRDATAERLDVGDQEQQETLLKPWREYHSALAQAVVLEQLQENSSGLRSELGDYVRQQRQNNHLLDAIFAEAVLLGTTATAVAGRYRAGDSDLRLPGFSS